MPIGSTSGGGGSISIGGGINIGSLVADVIADTTKWVKGLSNATVSMKGFTNNVNTFMEKNSQTMRTMGTRVALAGAAITTALGVAVKSYGDFDRAMRQAAAVSDATEGQFVKMSEMAEKASIKFNISATSAAKAFYYLGSAGLTVSEQMEAFNDVVAFAKAGVMDVGFSAETLVDVVKGTGATFAETVKVTDVLTKSFISSNMNLSQLGESMSLVAAVAAEAQTPLNEVATAFAFMANAGIKGSRAGTALRRAFVNLMDPTTEVRMELRRWGVEVFDANKKMRPFMDIMVDLTNSLKNATGEERKHAIATLFGVRAITGMLNVINQGPEALRAFSNEMENSGGTTKKVVDRQMKAFSEQAGVAWQEVKKLGRDIGRMLAPAVLDLAKGLGDAARAMTAFLQAHRTFGTVIFATIGSIGLTMTIVGSLTAALGSLGMVAVATGIKFTTLLGVLSAATLGVTALVAAITVGIMNYKHFQRENELLNEKINVTKESVEEATKAWVEYNKELSKTYKGQKISEVGRESLDMRKKALEVLELIKKERVPSGLLEFGKGPSAIDYMFGVDAWYKTSDEIKNKMKELGLTVSFWRDQNLASLETWANTTIKLQGKVGDAVEDAAKKEIQALHNLNEEQKNSTERQFDWWRALKSARDEYVEDFKRQYPTIEIYVKEGMKGVFEEVHSSFADSMADMAEGTKIFEQAFTDMLSRIHRALLDFFADIAARNIMMSLMGQTGGGSGGWGNLAGGVAGAVGMGAMSSNVGMQTDASGLLINPKTGMTSAGVPTLPQYGGNAAWLTRATGGYLRGGFRPLAAGGIVTNPTIGLVGEGSMNEAVVPLPNGRSIPVEMNGSGRPVVLNINVSAIDSRDTYRFLASNKRAIASLVNDAMRDNHPSRRT